MIRRGIAYALLLAPALLIPADAYAQAARSGPTFMIGGTTVPVEQPDVAFDPVNNRYLQVSGKVFIEGHIVSPAGAVIGTTQISPVGGPYAQLPRVAYSPDALNGAGGFLVTWHDSLTDPLNGKAYASVRGRIVDANGVPATPAFEISTSAIGVPTSTDWTMGASAAYSTTSKEFLVVWAGNKFSTGDILLQRVSNTGALLGVNTLVSGGGADMFDRDPSVAYNRDTNMFFVAYGTYVEASRIGYAVGRLVTAGTGAFVTGNMQLGTPAGAVWVPAVTYNTILRQYLVGWYSLGSSGAGVYGIVLNGADGLAAGAVHVLSGYYAAYDGLDIDYNQPSGSYLLVTHGAGPQQYEDAAVSILADGNAFDNGFIVTNTADVRPLRPNPVSSEGNFNPRLAASTQGKTWLIVTSSNFQAAHGQFVAGSTTGGPPPPPPPLTASMTVNVPPPVAEGTVLTWTASASGGLGPYSYQFWRFTTGVGWSMVQDWSALRTYSWIPTVGSHAVTVYVKNSGSTAATYDAYAETGLFSVTPPRARLTSFTTNVSFPTAPNVPITFTAQASTGVMPIQYKFWRFTEGIGWAMVQDYSSNNTYTWFPNQGVHAVQVWVRSSGSTETWEDWASTGLFTVAVSPARITSLTANRAFPVSPNVATVWTATGTGGSGPLEYQFWEFNKSSGVWSVLQAWSPSRQVTWTPGVPNTGQHALQVWVRTQGSGISYEDWRGTDWFMVTNSTSLVLNASLNLNNYSVQDGCVLYTALAGGPGVWEYQFWTHSNSDPAWTLRQGYSSAYNTFNFCPAAGTHAVQVWIRQAGSNALWERWEGTGYFVVRP